MESVYADAVFGWLGGGGALARVTYPWYELLHHNPTPILSCGKKKLNVARDLIICSLQWANPADY